MVLSALDQLTSREYNTFQTGYDWFNTHLFAGMLPPCLITLQRRRTVKGYFHADRFRHRLESGTLVDEIALNPDWFEGCEDTVILSTLVHEQAHLWQQHFGMRKSRRGYHNREWADKMQSLGLMPSNSGGPGGKRTGQQMSHYILPDGAFARAVADLLATGFQLHWESLAPRRGIAVGGNQQLVQDLSKVRFTCPACKQHAWAKSTAKLLCGMCTLSMPPELFVEEVSMENK